MKGEKLMRVPQASCEQARDSLFARERGDGVCHEDADCLKGRRRDPDPALPDPGAPASHPR